MFIRAKGFIFFLRWHTKLMRKQINPVLPRLLLSVGSLCLFWLPMASVSFAQNPPSATTPASTEDDRIVDQVRLRLAGDPDVKGGNLEVTAKDGNVVIKGRVETENGKTKAGKLAKKVKGVKSVDNQLSVGPLA